MRAAGRRCYSAVVIVALLAAVVGGIRLVLAEGARKEWALYLLVIPGQVNLLSTHEPRTCCSRVGAFVIEHAVPKVGLLSRRRTRHL